MKKHIILALSLFLGVTLGYSQGARSFRINEVVTDNQEGLIDEYGERSAWIEIQNTAWGTNNIRSCYLTTNREALNPDLTVPERIKLMSLIPKGDVRTALGAQELIVFFADGKTNLGTLHTNFVLNPEKTNFIALFDGNARTLLDSITVPPLGPNQAYARLYNSDLKCYKWEVLSENEVTPFSANKGEGAVQDKIAEFREKDPHGFAMTFMAMCVVFGCLISLYIFFHISGWVVVYMAN